MTAESFEAGIRGALARLLLLLLLLLPLLLPVGYIHVALGRRNQQPVFSALGQEARRHKASLIASLAAEKLHLLAVERLHGGHGEVLGFEQAGVALRIVAVFKQQHHRAAI